MGQMHGTNAWDKGLGQGHMTSVWGKCMGQVHVTRKPDMGKAWIKGIEKGIGVLTKLWDKGMRKGQGHGTMGQGHMAL